MSTAIPQQASLADVTEKVTVRNNTRRSLLVRVPGHSIHLLPWTTAEVPKAYLGTDELATLLRSGALVLATLPPGRASRSMEAPSGEGTADPARTRSAKKQK